MESANWNSNVFQRGSRLVSTLYTLTMQAWKWSLRATVYITIKLYKVAEAHTITTAKIVLTNAVLLRFVMIVPIIGALRKDQAWFHAKNIGLTLHWYTLQHWRESLSLVERYKTVFRLHGLDFNGYFEDCKSENTRANHPYKMQTKSAKVNSLKYSFFVKIIKDWNNLPNHLFTDEIRLSNFLNMQNGDFFSITDESQKRRLGEPLGGSGVFFPKKIWNQKSFEKLFLVFWEDNFVYNVHCTNRLPFFA